MARQVLSTLDFNSVARITNLPDAVAAQEPATLAQLNAAVEGLAWKDSCRVATSSNINVASPGATVDGVSMAAGDRMLLKARRPRAKRRLCVERRGLSPARALDCSTAAGSSRRSRDLGSTAAGTTRKTRQLHAGSGSVAWTAFGTGAGSERVSPPASRSCDAGRTDAGRTTRMVTPLKLATYAGRVRKFSASIGDGSATQFTLTHNFATLDVHVAVYRNSGALDEVGCDIEHATTNTVIVRFATAPTTNLFRVVVIG
jgi:hypothetical protein